MITRSLYFPEVSVAESQSWWRQRGGGGGGGGRGAVQLGLISLRPRGRGGKAVDLPAQEKPQKWSCEERREGRR